MSTTSTLLFVYAALLVLPRCLRWAGPAQGRSASGVGHWLRVLYVLGVLGSMAGGAQAATVTETFTGTSLVNSWTLVGKVCLTASGGNCGLSESIGVLRLTEQDNSDSARSNQIGTAFFNTDFDLMRGIDLNFSRYLVSKDQIPFGDSMHVMLLDPSVPDFGQGGPYNDGLRGGVLAVQFNTANGKPNDTSLVGSTGAFGIVPNTVATELAQPRTQSWGEQMRLWVQLNIKTCSGAKPLYVRIETKNLVVLEQCYGPADFGLTTFPGAVRLAISGKTGQYTQRNAMNSLTIKTDDSVVASSPYWNAPGSASNGIVQGGSGIWNLGRVYLGNANWTNASGAINTRWNSVDTAIFGGTAGTVTVDNSGGAVKINGLTFNTSGYTLSGGTLTGAAASNTLTAGSGISATVDSVLAGGNAFNKAGVGTITLTGANKYTGATTVSAGTLQVGAGSTSGSIASSSGVSVAAGAALAFNRSDAYSLGGAISGAGAVTKSGAGTTTLTGANNYTGATTVSAGTLQVGAGSTSGSIASSSGVSLAAGATLAFNRSDADSLGGAISGAGIVTKSGAGTTTLTGANTHTGTVNVNAGRLLIKNSVQASSIFNIASSAVLEFDTSANYNTNNTKFAGTGTLRKSGTGVAGWGSTTAATFALGSGSLIDVQAGTFNAQLGPSTEVWTNNKSNLNIASGAIFQGDRGDVYVDALSGGGTIVLSGAVQIGVDNGSGSFGGVFKNYSTAAGSLVKNGTGTQKLTGLNTYTGATTIKGGTLQIGNGGIGGSNDSTSGISIATGANLAFNRTDTYTASKIISGAGGVTQAGTGTINLTGNSTYTGSTTVSAGTLRVNGNQSRATGAVTVRTGATLGGSGSLGGVVTVNRGGILAPGNSPGTITVSGLSLPAGSSLNMELGQANTVGGSYNDLVQDNGDLNLGGGTLNVSVPTTPSGGAFTPGTYRLINYTGMLTDNGGLVLGTYPAGFGRWQLVIDTSTAGQVNLIVLAAGATYWDVSPQNNGVVDGGAGTWMPPGGGTNMNWTDSLGNSNTQWLAGGTANFGGTSGTVTVSGTQSISGLTFTTDGYSLTGGTLTGTAATNSLTAGTGIRATVGSVLAGGSSNVFDNAGAGTVILTGANTYSGATTVSAGTLVAGSNTALGTTAAGTTVTSGATLALTGGITLGAETLSLSGSGVGLAGALSNTAGANTFGGAVTLAAASTIGSAAGTLSLGSTVDNGGFTLKLDGAGNITASGVISGAGALSKTGAGMALLSAANTYGGVTAVSGGILQLGINGALRSTSATTVDAGAMLDINGKTQSLVSLSSSGTLALGAGGNLTLTTGASSIGAITGSGSITVNTGASLTLSAALVNSGVNIVLAGGTLNLGVFTHSMGTLSLTAASTLDFASAGTAQLTVATLNPAFALNVTNWTQGTDHFFATAVSGASARNTVNLSPLNNITLSGYTAQTTAWQSGNDEINAIQAPAVSMLFNPTSVRAGASSPLTIALSNPNAVALSAVAFANTYPANLINASPAGGATTCNSGSVTAAVGGNSVALSGGTIPANSSCTVTVNVTSDVAATYVNTLAAGALTSSGGSNASAASASLTVNAAGAAAVTSGRVFLDNGTGSGGVANDGIQNGSETPQSGIGVSLTNCSGTVYSSAVTSASGNYTLTVPSATAAGDPLCVAQTNQSGRTSTGASVGSTPLPDGTATLVAGTTYTYTRAAAPDVIAFTFNGSNYSALNFGDVDSSSFGASGVNASQPGNSVSYAHTFTARTAGSVSFGVASSVSSPAISGWNETISADPGCTGTLQAGAALLYPPSVATAVTAGQQVCVIVQEKIPSASQKNYRNDANIQATLTLANANPTLTATYTLDDVTTVSSSALALHKEVRNFTQNTAFGVNNQAKSGETLEYRITYSNNGATSITSLAIGDTTSLYTTFINALTGTTPASLSTCQKNTPANASPGAAVACSDAQAVGGTGAINFRFTGPLDPGAAGTVLFQLKVD